MTDKIREALFALADRIEEANGNPVQISPSAAHELRAALSLQLAAPAAPVAQEPVAWGAFQCSGRRAGKLYAHADTEAMIEAHILDVHRSNDSLTLRKGPLYTAPPAAEQPDTWTPSGADYDRNIHRNPDAAAWADLFVATFPGLADKRDLMLGWFANAMMAMHDHLKAQQPDTVAVPRVQLEELRSAIADYVAGSRRSRLESLTRSKELRVAERRVWLAARALLAGGAE